MSSSSMNKKLFERIKAVAFDLDGTIYYGDTLADKSLELTKSLREMGVKVFYFTNNSIKTREEIFEKLSDMGLELSINDVYTSAYATALYARENKLRKVYCMGSEGLIRELEKNGIQVINDGKNVDGIIVGFDTEFNYDKLSRALSILQKGCKLIVCNRDRNYLVENGRLLPGLGPIVAAIEYSYAKKADYMVGKPNTYMLKILAKEHKLRNNEILVVGDSYETDIKMARRYRCPSILISRKARFCKLDTKNTIVVDKIMEIKYLFGGTKT